MAETAEQKSRRLVSVSGDGGRPSVPVPGRAPSRAVVPTHTRAQLQSFMQREAEKVQEESNTFRGEVPSLEEALLPGATAPKEEVPSEPVSKPEVGAKPVIKEISSYDAEVLEMSSGLDPSELMLDGFITRELEIMPGVLTVTAKSFRKSDLTEIQTDIDVFRRGIPDPEKPSERIYPSSEVLQDFVVSRQLAQGLLGINGKALPARDWKDRLAKLEELSDVTYGAIRREFFKFLAAVRLLFPDKAEKEHIDRLKEALGKAKAHH